MEFMPKRGVVLILGAVVLASASGSAQSGKGRSKAPPAKAAPAKSPSAAPATAKDKDKDTAPASTDAEPASSAAPAMTGRGEAKTPPPKTYTSDGGVTVTEKGATKQFQFTETDVEGRLKVPQLVYFLRRVRAEFAAGDLGHRSFMRELSATQRDPDF
jgi:cytoskeletal protein RodZ